LPQPALNAYSSNLPDIHISPMRTYPSFEKLPVNNSRRVRVPIGILRKLGLHVVINQVGYANRLLALPIAIFVNAHSQAIHGPLALSLSLETGPLFRSRLFVACDFRPHRFLARETPNTTVQSCVACTLNNRVDYVDA
jgi:hypothetical protein